VPNGHFSQLGQFSEREEGSDCIQWEPSIFIFYSRVTLGPPPHINAATHTITNAFMCLRQRSVGKEGQLLIIKRYLFGSCGVLNSSYIWPFFCHISKSPAHVVQQQSPRVNRNTVTESFVFLFIFLLVFSSYIYVYVYWNVRSKLSEVLFKVNMLDWRPLLHFLSHLHLMPQ